MVSTCGQAKLIFSDQQVYQLQNQVLAFKSLIHDELLPANLVKSIGTLTANQWKAESERIYAETATVG